MFHSQSHAILRRQAEHHLAQCRHPNIDAEREGGQSSRFQTANTECRGAELGGGAGTQR